MSNFADIIRHGKKRFKVKDNRGKYGKCDYCDNRYPLFPYYDNKRELWLLCDNCTNIFVKEEE